MRILMVCLGNICRSPLAEGLMKHHADKAQLNWHVDSAGTGNWHVGEPPHHRSIKVAAQYGVDISGQRCRQFTAADLDSFDYIFVMDTSNRDNVLRMASRDEHRAKVSLMLDVLHPGQDREVPDPYHGDFSDYENVFAMLDEACKTFVSRHTKNGKES